MSMAAPQPRRPDRSAAEEGPTDPENMNQQLTHPAKGSVSPNPSQDGAAAGSQKEPVSQSVSIGLSSDGADAHAHQPQALHSRGYGSSTGEWDDLSHYANPKELEVASPGVYNDNHSLVFHTGYGYSPHMPYGPYSPVTTPLPSVGGDVQMYSSQQFPYSGQPYYQQLLPPTMPYISSPTQVSQPDLTMSMNVDQQGDGVLFGPRPNYPSPVGSFGRGSFPGNLWTHGFHDQQMGLDGLSSGGLWSDWSKPVDRQRSFSPLSPAASPQPIGIGPFTPNIGIASDLQRTLSGYGSSDPYNRDFLHSGINRGANFGTTSIPGFGLNGQGWLSVDNRRRRRSNGAICSCNGTSDILGDQNRGPRASKLKNHATSEHGSSIDDSKLSASITKIPHGSYNHIDFITEYDDAKFFVIKSYSEDNVHKSIKYGVWASTPNGNRKLDAAYREAKEKPDTCPVFLFFSVNASAHFCGVAEMVGPVDFDRSFDYWQQDRWSGQFPVKWHVIKDVPNSQLRHIVLENNDNKPVTNSRDTQEVKLEQGIEMLNIFKNYETDTSILDDFEFYEEREKVIQEGKARQQASPPVVGVAGKNEQRNQVMLASDFIDKMSKSFGQVMRVDEDSKDDTVADMASPAHDSTTGTRVDFQDSMPVSISSAQTS